MSFQGYLNTIKTKTGLGPDDFRKLANEKGYATEGKLNKDVKASDIIKWLKEDYDLGHGHSMAIVALLQGHKKEGDS